MKQVQTVRCARGVRLKGTRGRGRRPVTSWQSLEWQVQEQTSAAVGHDVKGDMVSQLIKAMVQEVDPVRSVVRDLSQRQWAAECPVGVEDAEGKDGLHERVVEVPLAIRRSCAVALRGGPPPLVGRRPRPPSSLSSL